MKGLAILAWRDDVGAYILECFPESVRDIMNDFAMNIYNSHRFRTTDANFKILKRGDFNAASFYSGGYQSSYIAKPNYCVTLILEEKDNPNAYEKVLIKAANNLLSKLDSDDFDYLLEDIFYKIKEKRFDEIEVMREGGFEFEDKPETTKKKLATTSSASLSDEEQIFEDLMSSSEFMPQDDKEEKLADFESTSAPSDPFSGGEPGSDPFSGGGSGQSGSRDIFAENPFGGGGSGGASTADPFTEAQKPKIGSSMSGMDETIGKKLFKKRKTSAKEIVAQLDALEEEKPTKPSETDQETQFKYLETLVSYLQEKVNILGKLVNGVKELEKTSEEKDKLIGKLLLLLEEKS